MSSGWNILLVFMNLLLQAGFASRLLKWAAPGWLAASGRQGWSEFDLAGTICQHLLDQSRLPLGVWRNISSQWDCQPCSSPIPASSSTSSGDCCSRCFHILISLAWSIQRFSTSLWIWSISQWCCDATCWDQIISSSRVSGRNPIRLRPVICSSSNRRSTLPRPKKWRRIIYQTTCSRRP